MPTEQEIAIKAAGEEGEKIAEDMLRYFVSHDIINGYLSTENVCVNGSFFEIDFLVFKVYSCLFASNARVSLLPNRRINSPATKGSAALIKKNIVGPKLS